ncbi:hypothetical protein ACQKMD_21720 [Viridibacillus sp. NPDC096237]|uniref:hypothetical protein n=1 Tax=Viridibacillus sp. NPDC096237 TaxID=3390721 RepID=UPI003CFD25A9
MKIMLDQPKIESTLRDLPPNSQAIFTKILGTIQEALSYVITTTLLVRVIMVAAATIICKLRKPYSILYKIKRL